MQGEDSRHNKQVRITETGSFVNIDIEKRKRSSSPVKMSPDKAAQSPIKDKFSKSNREAMLGESAQRQNVQDRMKNYGRFLKYDGVAFLKPEQKKIYQLDKLRQMNRQENREATNSPISSPIDSMGRYDHSPMSNTGRDSIEGTKDHLIMTMQPVRESV